MTSTILVPLDGSSLAEQGLAWAAALARKTGARLILLSAVEPLETWMEAAGINSPGRNWEEETAAAAAYLSSQRERLQEEGVTAQTTVTWGKAPDCIRQAAATLDAALIVMTTHGRSGLPRLVLGSVASEVVHTASQPVLLVKATEQPPVRCEISRILVPVDGSPMSASVVPTVEALARQLHADIVLLRVITPSIVLYPGEELPSAPPVLENIEASARDYLERLAVTVRHDGFKVECELVPGEASGAIQDAAERWGVDLIAMSSHGRAGLARFLMGSTADAVVRQSGKPVLIVRPQAIVKAQLSDLASPAIEILEGVSVAPTLVPPPDMTEVALETDPAHPLATAGPARRPERRSLS